MAGKLIKITAIAALVAIVLFSDSLLGLKNSISQQTSGLVGVGQRFLASIFSSETSSNFSDLITENEKLKAQILELSKKPRFIEIKNRQLQAVKIYSNYPFNNRDLISVSAGLNYGLSPLMPVLVEESFLFGQVTEVFGSYSIVRTIFDAGWELPVKIGSENIDALLVGGREPVLTLIAKEKKIEPGQSVYAASQNFPYGLKIGVINDIKSDLGDSFQQATLSFSYDAANLSEVFILIK